MKKGELVDMLIPEDMQSKIDYALPQSWVDGMVKLTDGFNVCGNFVWLYDSRGGTFGRPFPLTNIGSQMLEKYNIATGAQFPIDSKVF